MLNKAGKKLSLKTIGLIITAILIWTVFFWNNSQLKDALVDIHLIFLSTITAYFIIRISVNPSIIDLLKIFIRTVFRVWLLIFITFALSKSMDKVGSLLSLTYIFGYLEGLFDINKWLETNNPFLLFPPNYSSNKIYHSFATIQVMGFIHILSAIVVFIFYLLF